MGVAHLDRPQKPDARWFLEVVKMMSEVWSSLNPPKNADYLLLNFPFEMALLLPCRDKRTGE